MEKFKAAIGYAKVAIKDPELRAAYTLIAPAGTSGFNMAFSDFYSSPEIVSTDVSDFRNNGYVLVQAKDDFRVASVTVTLLNGEGTALESGEAISTPESGELWSYNATGATTDAVSLRIEVRDLPGNVTAQELPLAA
ncbi:hypothetical protein MKQ70_18085 [Chitinophaga sedimenti]|uniref:hypothetical protein n=1 Tax=Chitinophaga sedimenti TaxID=2033606 RepID=UPI0020064C4D|nr:hypothetical protein [Chitinophaga sedimenti]MCK7556825.1 hypothetical protein [Chitinophaga sedimenti]